MARKPDARAARIQREISLVDLAGTVGFRIDKTQGNSPKSRLGELQNGSGDRLIIYRDSKQWGLRDSETDNNIFAFAMEYLGCPTYGAAVATLGRMLKSPPPPAEKHAFPHRSRGTGKGGGKRKSICAEGQKLGRPKTAEEALARARKYRGEARGLTSATLAHFSGSWRENEFGNAFFPHEIGGGKYGEIKGERWDIRGATWTQFSSGENVKSYWIHGPQQALELVVCESAIDAMSYAQAKDFPAGTAYASLAGEGKRETLAMVCAVARKRGSSIVIALDKDEAGEKKTADLAAAAEAAVVEWRRELPELKDWNAIYEVLEDQDLEFEDGYKPDECDLAREASSKAAADRLAKEGDPFNFAPHSSAAADFSQQSASSPEHEKAQTLGE